MQLRVTPILQRTLTSQQSAFLPGRNIHHALLLMSEMLQRARESGENHILLKLDVWKAFDRLEWPFLLAMVEKTGMGGILSSFLEASFHSASSLILLNGRPTNSFKLSRSVRQGCPLSPLLFNLAFDALSRMFNRAIATKYIIGVEFPSLALSTLHTMFADNLSLIIRAIMLYVVRCRQMLMTFGAVSGLQFLWEQTVAAFIPEGPPPMEFRLLPWKWEVSTDASPLLAFPVAATFSVELMETKVLATIDSCLDKLRGKHLSLAARITVANGLILSSIWYIMALWAGDFSFFQTIQRKLEAFVWSGRHRVDRNTLSQSRSRGGLGLISVADQYRSMAGTLMVWVLGPGVHPLRLILQSHIKDLSRRKWGIEDLTWIVSKGGSTESLGSPSWKNICKAWSSLKPMLRHAPPRNTEEWSELPLWRPHIHHISESKVKCTTRAQQRLYQAGILTNGDISTAAGQFKPWHDLPVNHEDTEGRRAYEALIANLRPPAPFDPQRLGLIGSTLGKNRLILRARFGYSMSSSN